MLLVAPAAGAVSLTAESVAITGETLDLQASYVQIDAAQGLEPPRADGIIIDGTDISVEAWYQDSGGTTVPIFPETTVSTLAEGQVTAVGAAIQPTFQLNVLAPDGATISGLSDLTLQPHSQSQGGFPEYVWQTGNEFNVTLAKDPRAAVHAATTISFDAPFTMAFWSWNFTVNGDAEAAWSGQRPHGEPIAGRHPQGLDKQLLVFHVREGTATMQLDPQHIEQLFIRTQEFQLQGQVNIKQSTVTGTPDGSTNQSFEGNLTIKTSRIDNHTLNAIIAQQERPGLSGTEPIEAPTDPIRTPETHDNGNAMAAPISPESSTAIQALMIAGLAILALGLVAYGTRWKRLVAHFSAQDYRYVARHAATFHASSRHAGDAQVMTMVAAIKLGHYEIVRDNLGRLPDIDAGARAILEGHALIGLGLIDDAQKLLDELRSTYGTRESLTHALESSDPSAAYA